MASRVPEQVEGSDLRSPPGHELGPLGEACLPATPEEREHSANVLRFQVATKLGIVLWIAFGAVDLLVCQVIGAGAGFWTLAVVRLSATPFHLCGWLLLHKRPMVSPRELLAIDTLCFGAASALLAVLASFAGGIAGPYTPGVFLVLICRNSFLVQPWRLSVLPNATIVLAHFLALALAEYASPGCVLTVGPLASLALVALHLCSLSAGAVVLSAAANTTWALRRRVFEARTLGRYRLINRVAEGGHGEVWRAYNPGLRSEVAIKVLRSELAEDERAVARFEREIDALCQLRHPHTIRILDYGVTSDGVCYYAMELLEGMTLAQLVEAEGCLPPGRAIHLALQVAHALAEAHENGIVHRDIKPENVFVLFSGNVADFVKLIDFGIAKRREVQAEQRVTAAGRVVGTPAFMAPEVALGRACDFRGDVYGVGALIYFMLTGAPPVSDRVELGEQVPRELRHVLACCLARAPDHRPPDAAMLALALEGLDDSLVWRPRAALRHQERASSQAAPTRTLPALPST